MLATHHRAACVHMVQIIDHVDHQLTNSQTRAKYLLETIKFSDAGIRSSMVMVMNDDGPRVKLNDLETTAAHLLPYDPVVKRKTNKGVSDYHATISDSAAEISLTSTSGKPDIGKIFVGTRLKSLRSCQKPKGVRWSNGNIAITARKDLPLRGKGLVVRTRAIKRETQILVSKLVSKELGGLNKDEVKEEVKGKELKAQVMAIL